jgi:hypothetical protein
MTYARVFAESQYKSAVETIKTCTSDKVELGIATLQDHPDLTQDLAKVAFTHKGRVVYTVEGVFNDLRWFFIKE